jgi:predicted amidohydrolase YtcJ
MASKIFYGTPIYTMDDERKVAEAVVVVEGKVEYVASDSDEALALYPDSELIRLDGGCILPGFVDAHLHLRDFSLLFRDLDLSQFREKQEVLDGVHKTAAKKKGGKWLAAGGLANPLLESLSRQELDSAAPGVPVLLFSGDMHSAVASSAALLKAGIDETRADPMGGRIERDAAGIPNGVLRERAVEILTRIVPDDKARRVDVALERGMKKLLSCGITTFCDCSAGLGQNPMKSLVRLAGRGRLPARGVMMLGEGDAAKLGDVGIPSLFGDARLRIGGLKVIMDGSLGSLTGHMSRPYVGGGFGMLLMSEEELYTLLKKSYSNRIWAAVHCIGDKANEIALNVFQKLEGERGVPSLLQRIEHAQSLKDEDIERVASLGVIAVVNPNHIPIDREKAIRHLGPDARLLYRFRSLIAAGAQIAFASDAPVASVNPFHILYCAVERKDFRDGPELRFYPKEKISLADAVRAYTIGGAAALGLEKEIGSLEPGKTADFIHVSKDIFQQDTAALSETEVLATYLEGMQAYSRAESEK